VLDLPSARLSVTCVHRAQVGGVGVCGHTRVDGSLRHCLYTRASGGFEGRNCEDRVLGRLHFKRRPGALARWHGHLSRTEEAPLPPL
jgi:hypothetical protein